MGWKLEKTWCFKNESAICHPFKIFTNPNLHFNKQCDVVGKLSSFFFENDVIFFKWAIKKMLRVFF
jgi:hypothetical protein